VQNVHRIFIGLKVVALLACCTGGAAARAQVAPADLKPKIVLQAAGTLPEVAAWLPGDRYLVTGLGLTHQLIIWDTQTGAIVDRVQLPMGNGASGSDYLRLAGIDISADGKTAFIHGIIADLTAADAAASREFSADLASRAVTVLAPRPLPAGTKGISAVVQRISALSVLSEGATDMTPAAAEKLLPVLPRSNGGRLALKRAEAGLLILDGARTVRTLKAAKILSLSDGALAPDGHRLALITQDENDEAEESTIEWFDLLSAGYSASLQLAGDYGEIAWLDANTVLVSYKTDSNERDPEPDNEGLPAPVQVIDARTTKVIRSFPARCYVRPLPDGGFIGAGLANCRSKVGSDKGLQVWNPARASWQATPTPWLGAMMVDNLTVSPDAAMLAVTVMDTDQVPGVVMVERTTGKVVDTLSFPKTKGFVTNVRFAPDGKTLIVAVNGGLHFWKPGDAASRPMDVVALVPQMMVNDGRTLLVSSGADQSVTRVDLQSGKRLAPLELANAVAGGFVPGKPLFWAASYINGIRLWDTRDWREILTTYHFDGRKFLAVTPEGIYDTNLGPDAQQFRWIVPDAPFQSLAPQTFMRDYFEPQLTRRRIDCTIARNCADVFKALPPIAALNRVLPSVTILGVVPDATGTKATVTVRVIETFDPEAKNVKTRSGIYAVRLFRNNRLVAQSPALDYRGPYVDNPLANETGNSHDVLAAKVEKIVETEPERVEATLNSSVEAWRILNQVRGAENNPNMQFTVDLPTGPGSEQAEFSAYAFNEDRVKSDTARLTFRQPVIPQPRPRRAFVITIGIDAYDEPRLALHFAAGDAKLIATRLRAIQGYTDVRTITLTGERGADGKVTRVTRRSIQLLLSALGAGDPDVAKRAFAELGLDASQLDQTTPDDIVIFSFSGHGWADKKGNFYLVPSDGMWRASDETPDKATLISAAELTRAFTALRAGEVALIIDACHSGASVDTGGFKPGPMGDAGLGQLAFDKGLRILAASQASDVAFEDPVLQQGLLTYALAREGITPDFGKADENGDGRIVLDEWLRYAVGRLPSLSEESRSGRVAAAAGTGRPGGSRDLDLLDAGPVAQAKPQEPALFDFTGVASPIVLRARQP
jgi:hypothetical protein